MIPPLVKDHARAADLEMRDLARRYRALGAALKAEHADERGLMALYEQAKEPMRKASDHVGKLVMLTSPAQDARIDPEEEDEYRAAATWTWMK